MKTRNNNPERADERDENRNNTTNQNALDKAMTNPVNAEDVDGIVGERTTGSNPNDIAGVSDLDATMRRGSRYSRRNK